MGAVTEGFGASCGWFVSGFSLRWVGWVLDVHLFVFFFTNLRPKVKNTENEGNKMTTQYKTIQGKLYHLQLFIIQNGIFTIYSLKNKLIR